ncbi:hypothetical protein PG999_014010 [Apiospora kogelbergensis]|uniref:Uncharacterized protein n=1 Tax=Apiospora kogelbergensis TaxID=1337665 RepID=A0AAW0QDU6_9PEZI
MPDGIYVGQDGDLFLADYPTSGQSLAGAGSMDGYYLQAKLRCLDVQSGSVLVSHWGRRPSQTQRERAETAPPTDLHGPDVADDLEVAASGNLDGDSGPSLAIAASFAVPRKSLWLSVAFRLPLRGES